MSYNCEIVADSLSPQGDILTTFKITFPRIVLAELNTHRMFSRNSASSRAIPFNKMVKSVEENPFIPIAWQKDHKGMQGIEYLTEQIDIDYAVYNWKEAVIQAIKQAKSLNSRVTKQLCNRLLEPYMWHTVLITTSEEGLETFFNLRCPQYIFMINENGIQGKTVFKSKKDAIKRFKRQHGLVRMPNGFSMWEAK